MVDKAVGTAGTLRITDNGSVVSFWVLCSDPATNVGTYRFAINGTAGTTSLPSGFGSRLLGQRTITTSQTVSLSQQATGTRGLGGADIVYASIARATVPPAPTAVSLDATTPTSTIFRFSSNGNGGSALLRWEAQIASNAAFTTGVQTVTSSGTTTFTNLNPATAYFARARGVNAIGNGAWSSVLATVTASGAYASINGTWVPVPINFSDDGAWVPLAPLASDGSAWRQAL